MEVSVAQQDLERLDRLEADTLLLFFPEEEGPLGGLPGLVDWRLTGRLSRYLQRGWFTGGRGEKLLMPTHLRLPMVRILGFGIGPPSELDLEAVERIGELAGRTLKEARAKSVALALPGEPEAVEAIRDSFRVLRRGLSRQFDGPVVLLGDVKLLKEAVDELPGARS